MAAAPVSLVEGGDRTGMVTGVLTVVGAGVTREAIMLGTGDGIGVMGVGTGDDVGMEQPWGRVE